MNIGDLPYEIIRHILSYNIFPWCISTSSYLHDVEMDLMEEREKWSEEYLYLDDAMKRHGYEMFLYLLRYSEKCVVDINDLVQSMVEKNVDVRLHMRDISSRFLDDELFTLSLYDNNLSYLVVDLARESNQINDIMSMVVAHNDIETIEWLLIYGASLDVTMNEAIRYNNDRLISILVSQYGMEYPYHP